MLRKKMKGSALLDTLLADLIGSSSLKVFMQGNYNNVPMYCLVSVAMDKHHFCTFYVREEGTELKQVMLSSHK